MLASVLDTAGLVGADVAPGFITVALAGVGLGADLDTMRRTGPRPLVLGAIVSVLVASSGIGLQALTGQL